MTRPNEINGHETGGAGAGQAGPEQGQPLGMVIEGSVASGVEVRLDPEVSVEQVKVGRSERCHRT